MTEVTLRPYIDGRIPSRGASSRLLQEGRADVEVRFIELVGSGSARVYYPVESDNEIVAPCEGGRYFVDAVCPAVLGTDGRIARIFPPLEWVEGEDPLLVGDAEADRARVERLQEEKNERFEAARAALDEEMENLDERLETSRADITQAQEDAAEAFNKADSAATVAANLRTAIDLGLMRTGKASSPPEVGKGLTWAVLDEDTGEKVAGLRIANAAGTEWTPYQLIAEDLMVVGAGGTVRLKDGVVDADVILANDALYKKLATSEFWATLATVENLVVTSKMLGNEIEGKVFKGGLVRGAKVETDALTVGPQVQTGTSQTLW